MDRDSRKSRPTARFLPPTVGIAALALLILLMPGPARGFDGALASEPPESAPVRATLT